ncbi:MAG: hypothetical protein LUI06_08040 [Ruminococcus sp.]|nr:hypothetical protein [Ruminococcus sp.]
MIIKHFGGIEAVNTLDEVCEVLRKRYGDDVNEFWITYDNQENPCLAILVNKEFANVTYFPDAESIGFQSVGIPSGFNSDEFSVFCTNTPEEEIEISNSTIITFDEALQAALDFFQNPKLPNCIKWSEN